MLRRAERKHDRGAGSVRRSLGCSVGQLGSVPSLVTLGKSLNLLSQFHRCVVRGTILSLICSTCCVNAYSMY